MHKILWWEVHFRMEWTNPQGCHCWEHRWLARAFDTSVLYVSVDFNGTPGLCYFVSYIWKSPIIAYTNSAHTGNRHSNCKQSWHLGNSCYASLRMLLIWLSVMRKCRCTLCAWCRYLQHQGHYLVTLMMLLHLRTAVEWSAWCQARHTERCKHSVLSRHLWHAVQPKCLFFSLCVQRGLYLHIFHWFHPCNLLEVPEMICVEWLRDKSSGFHPNPASNHSTCLYWFWAHLWSQESVLVKIPRLFY